LLFGGSVKLLSLSHDACDIPTLKIVAVADKQTYEYDGHVKKRNSLCLNNNCFNTYAVS
jgi:hypothetical protein